MFKHLTLFLILINLYFVSNVYAQPVAADSILRQLKEKYLAIEDYQADIEINVDVDFINIPTKKAHIFFKAPDLYKFDAKGFFMLPKKGMNFSVTEMLNYHYTAIWVKSEFIDSIPTEVLKIIPIDSDLDIVLTTLWIDEENLLIKKIETNTKNAGSFSMKLSYRDMDLGLPEKARISFEVTPFELPMNFTGDFKQKAAELDKNKKTKGAVTIIYRNYKINDGLSDNIFKKDKL